MVQLAGQATYNDQGLPTDLAGWQSLLQATGGMGPPGEASTPTFDIPTNSPIGIGAGAPEQTTYTSFNPAANPQLTAQGNWDVLQNGVETPAALLGSGAQINLNGNRYGDPGPPPFYPNDPSNPYQPSSNNSWVGQESQLTNQINLPPQQPPGGGGFPAIPLTPPVLNWPNVPTLNFGTATPQNLPAPNAPHFGGSGSPGAPISFVPGSGGSGGFGSGSGGGGSNIAPGGGASGPPQAPQNLANPYGLGFGGNTPSGVPGGAPNSVTVPTPHGPVSFPMPNVSPPASGSPMLSGNISQNRNLIAQGLPGGGNGPVSDASGPQNPLAYNGRNPLGGLAANPAQPLNPLQQALQAVGGQSPPQGNQQQQRPQAPPKSPIDNGHQIGINQAQDMAPQIKNVVSPEQYRDLLSKKLGGPDENGDYQPGDCDTAAQAAYKDELNDAQTRYEEADRRKNREEAYRDSLTTDINIAKKRAMIGTNPTDVAGNTQELYDKYDKSAGKGGFTLNPISLLHKSAVNTKGQYQKIAQAAVDKAIDRSSALFPELLQQRAQANTALENSVTQLNTAAKGRQDVLDKINTTAHTAKQDTLDYAKALMAGNQEMREAHKVELDNIDHQEQRKLTAQANAIAEQRANTADKRADTANTTASNQAGELALKNRREDRLQTEADSKNTLREQQTKTAEASQHYLEHKSMYNQFGMAIAGEVNRIMPWLSGHPEIPQPKTPQDFKNLAESYKQINGYYPKGYQP